MIATRQRRHLKDWLTRVEEAYRRGEITAAQYSACTNPDNLSRWWPLAAPPDGAAPRSASCQSGTDLVQSYDDKEQTT